jgi:hypothetical protein
MSLWSDFIGTSSGYIRLGLTGVRIKNSTGVLSVRNAADSADASINASGLALGSGSITMTGSLGSTGSRLTKGWFTDLQCTNAIAASITGSAPTLTTPRAIYGNNFDGSAALTQVIDSAYGGTGNGFAKLSGPTTSEKTFTLPDASTTILTTNAAVTVAQGGTGLATLTANNVILGNGTSTPAFVAPGTSGNILTSNGTTWTSAASTAAQLGVTQTWTKGQSGAYVSLTSSSNSIAIDLAASNNYSHTLTENTTLAAPSNPTAGLSGVIQFTQNASSAKTLSYNTFWKFADGVVPSISTTLSSVQQFFYVVDDGGSSATCVLMAPRS